MQFDFEIDEDEAGDRLDRIVAQRAGISRARASELFDSGRVAVDSLEVQKSQKGEAGGRVTFELEEVPEFKIEPEEIDFGIVFEDTGLAVISKPAGLAVHAGAGRAQGNLTNGLLARWPAIAAVGEASRPGIVHRLDAETSGLLLVALNAETHRRLSAMIKSREVSRDYLALVNGVPQPPSGAVDAPIGRDPRHRTRMAVIASGRHAQTSYSTECSWPERAALLSLSLITGRTHQIRVHMAAVGHPIVGDQTYGGKRLIAGSDVLVARPMLHASRLAFEHPISGEQMTFIDPVPADMAAVIDSLGAVGSGDIPRDLVRRDGPSCGSVTR